MVQSIYQFINRIATWQATALLVVIMLLTNQGFNARQEALGAEKQVLDVRLFGYTPEQARQLFAELGKQRFLYAWSELTLDIIFPLAYGLLFAILIARTWGEKRAALLLFPILTVIFDLLENLTSAYLAFSFDGSVSNLAWFAAACTLTKSLLFLISMLLVVMGGFNPKFDEKIVRPIEMKFKRNRGISRPG